MASENKMTASLRPSAWWRVLWALSFFCTIGIAALLCLLCLFSRGGVFARESSAGRQAGAPARGARPAELQAPAVDDAQSAEPSRADRVAFENQSKMTGLEATTSEMSKRIDEVGNHATQVLNVIGLLIGFMTAVVAIGLWQSKQYIDRVVSHSKTEMEKFIRELAEEQLRNTKSALSEQFQRTTEETFEELGKRAGGALREVGELQHEANSVIEAFSRKQMEATLYVMQELFGRFAQALNEALGAAPDSASISPGDLALIKGNLKNMMFTQMRLLEALVQLESSKSEEVLGACHTISALGDYTYLPTIERTLARWQETQNHSVVKQITAVRDKLSSVQGQA